MSDDLDVKAGYTPDDVAALMEALRGMVDLEEGELYTLRKGRLHHVVRRDEENGLRRILVMEEAYGAAQQMARRLRQRMRGYRPDPVLIVSAHVMHAAGREPEHADEIAIQYLQQLFQRATPAAGEDGNASVPRVEAGDAPAPRRGAHATRGASIAL